MRRFEFSTHVNPEIRYFIGCCWEDGGVHCDEDGTPKTDVLGNSLSHAQVVDVTPDDWQLVFDSYTDSSIDDWEHFRGYCTREIGLSPNDANKVLIACGYEEPTSIGDYREFCREHDIVHHQRSAVEFHRERLQNEE